MIGSGWLPGTAFDWPRPVPNETKTTLVATASTATSNVSIVAVLIGQCCALSPLQQT